MLRQVNLLVVSLLLDSPVLGLTRFVTLEHITAGAAVDSGYEYILKQYLLTGDIKARDQCERFSFVSIMCVDINFTRYHIC